MIHLARVAVLAAALLALAGCGVSRTGSQAAEEEVSSIPPITGFDEPAESSESSESDGPSRSGECGFEREPGEDAPVGLPPDEEATDAADVVLTTNHGELTIALEPDDAPCTVRSFTFLVDKGFYDDTECHRLTASSGLKVLQCGDPDGNGSGGPGYTIPDELPTDLPRGPTGPDGNPTAIYQRGIVAMANRGPDTGGSQFFLVYGDSPLPASYSVFGKLDATGLATLDTIAAGGVVPGANGPEDGAPRLPVTIESAKVS